MEVTDLARAAQSPRRVSESCRPETEGRDTGDSLRREALGDRRLASHRSSRRLGSIRVAYAALREI